MDLTYDSFWSYAHDDDSRSYGRVSKLAGAITDEFALTTGTELELFLDRKSIRWGDAWRSRIDEAVGEAPFFLAVITPSYLKSIECRRELIAFSRSAKSRGLDRLLLPILYIDVPGLEEDSSDEVKALVARTQYLDWRHLRSKKLDSEEHLEAVHALATELAQRREEMATVTLRTESRTSEDEIAELQATLEAIAEKLPAWMEAVEFDSVAGGQWQAALKARMARMSRLREQGAPRGAILSTSIQLGKELLPIAANRLEKAQTYAKVTIELDPLVDRAIRLVELHPDRSDLLFDLKDGVNEAWINIQREYDDSDRGYLVPANLPPNQHLVDSDALLDASYIHVVEGNRIVIGWRNALRQLEGLPPELTDDPDYITVSESSRA